MEAGNNVKREGKDNNLLELIEKEELFKPVHGRLGDIVDSEKFIGRAPEQTAEFIKNEIDPILEKHKDSLGEQGKVNV